MTCERRLGIRPGRLGSRLSGNKLHCHGANEICKEASDMVYAAIRQRCKEYHQRDTSGYDGAYARYTEYRTQTQAKWDNPDRLDSGDAKELITFLNRWRCKIPFNDSVAPEKVILDLWLNNHKTGAPLPGAFTIKGITMQRLLNNLAKAVPHLNTLQNATLLDVKLDQATKQMIAGCFDTIAKFGIKKGSVSNEAVATSKILHAAINPKLFVMWDNDIQERYIPKHLINTGDGYARVFLPRMQVIAERAVDEVMRNENLSCTDAIQSFTEHCEKKNSLAKIIDEYNFAKFK